MSFAFWTIVGILVVVAVIFISKILKGQRGNLSALGTGDRVNLTMNAVMFVLTVISILIALAAFQDSKISGDAQKKALERSRDSLQDVVNTLKTQTSLLNDAQDTLKAQLSVSRQQQKAMIATNNVLQGTRKTLKSQLDISVEQNSRELDRLNRKPRVKFQLSSLLLGVLSEDQFSGGITVQSKDASDLTLTVINTGDASLANPTLIFAVVPNAVEIFSPGYGHIEGERRDRLQFSGPSIVQSLEPAAQLGGGGYTFKFGLSMPESVSSGYLLFRIYGNNMAMHEATIRIAVERPNDAKQ